MKKYIYIIFTIILALAAGNKGYSQQIPHYSQYIFNSLIINPAYAGTKGTFNTNALHRTQWTGMEGAPATQTLAADGAVSESIGLGFHAINDRTGLLGTSLFSGNFAYRIRTGEYSRLSLGVSGGAFVNRLDGSGITTDMPDTGLPSARETRVSPNASAGVFFHTANFFAGFSVGELTAGMYAARPVYGQARHYFLTAGYIMPLSEEVSLKTSFLARDDLRSPMALDINTFLLFFDRVWIGASWRTSANVLMPQREQNNLRLGNAVALMTEIYATPSLRIGYAYDITTSVLRNFHTHEISLGYTIFNEQKTAIKNPRYF